MSVVISLDNVTVFIRDDVTGEDRLIDSVKDGVKDVTDDRNDVQKGVKDSVRKDAAKGALVGGREGVAGSISDGVAGGVSTRGVVVASAKWRPRRHRRPARTNVYSNPDVELKVRVFKVAIESRF